MNEMLAERASRVSGVVWSAPVRGQLEAQLEQLKEKLVRPIVETITNTDLIREIAWAANEAAALAWYTVCPILILPALLDEKVRAAFKKWEKQQRLQNQHEPQ